MKKVMCEAIVPEQKQRDNLCQCVTILGGDPKVNNDKVSVEYSGEKWETMIELFEHFMGHSITVT